MKKGRMEAFSDGVIAIIITIMVLEIKVPHGGDLSALIPLIPVFMSYVLSFIYLGIYWNNHHHLLQAVGKVNGRILWANLHLLFWLSMVPVATHWIGHSPLGTWPVAVYGVILMCAGIAYYILTRVLIAHHGSDSTLAHAVGKDIKGQISVVIYAIAILLAFLNTWISLALYVLVAIMWLIPDRRIEHVLTESAEAMAD